MVGSHLHCGNRAPILIVGVRLPSSLWKTSLLLEQTSFPHPRGKNHIPPSYGNTTPVVWKYDWCGMGMTPVVWEYDSYGMGIWLLWYENMTPMVWEYDSHGMGMTPISYGSKTHPFTNEQRGSHHRQGVNTFETEVKDCLLFPLLKRSKAPKGHPGII